MNTVYDTTVIGKSNVILTIRQKGSPIDRRLLVIEEFVKGKRIAWYNNTLSQEYDKHIKKPNNDIIIAFVYRLTDKGIFSKRNKLRHSDFSKAISIRWPSHDQHLLALGIESIPCTLFVTEKKLKDCSKEAKRVFGITVLEP